MHGTATKEYDGRGDDPRHIFLNSAAVFARYGWGRTYGYQMLNSEGFPSPLGRAWRLDRLMSWEERVLAGELQGSPTVEEVQPSDSELQEAQPVDDAVELPVRRASRRKRAA